MSGYNESGEQSRSPPQFRLDASSLNKFSMSQLHSSLEPEDLFERNGNKVYANQVVEFQKSVTVDDMLMPDVSRVLVIYTGGTIGMKNTKDKGYEPASNYLIETLSSMTRFHDPYNLFSSSGSGHVSPKLFSRENSFSNLDHLKNQNINLGYGNGGKLDYLVTPPSLYGKRIKYRIKEYDPLLDSCNMTMADWIKIACDIETNYQKYDAFIVLHGTDTMAFTASALSFMLEDLGKTVIITGSQVPISEVRNDAIENLLGALTVAGHFVIPEVCLYFGNKLFRGNRSSKVSAIDFDAFDSPNLRPLVHVGVNIDVNWAEVLKPRAIGKFKVHKKMNPNVASLRLFPGITEVTIRAFLSQDLDGVVLETFGAGNAPNNPNLIQVLKDASQRGVVIVNCTQCKKGSVSDLYATAKGLALANVVPGSDMTPECALTKLSYLLAKNFTPDRVRTLMRQNLRGELTGALFIKDLEANPNQDGDLDIPTTAIQLLASQLVNNHLNSNENSGVINSQPTPTSNSPCTTFNPGNSIERALFPILLCSAAATNDIQCLHYLKKNYNQHFQVNCVDYDSRTPIHIAASHGHYDAAQFLLKNGAALHLLDQFGHTPLYYAAFHRYPQLINLLRNDGAHFNISELPLLADRFTRAAATGSFTTLKYFIDAGLDVNIQNTNFRTALHQAALNNQVQTVNFLCKQHSLDPTLQDQWGRSPLDDANANFQRAQFNQRDLDVAEQILHLIENCKKPKPSLNK